MFSPDELKQFGMVYPPFPFTKTLYACITPNVRRRVGSLSLGSEDVSYKHLCSHNKSFQEKFPFLQDFINYLQKHEVHWNNFECSASSEVENQEEDRENDEELSNP